MTVSITDAEAVLGKLVTQYSADSLGEEAWVRGSAPLTLYLSFTFLEFNII